MFRLNENYRIILASGSPRRKELLSDLGIAFEIHVADVDEAEIASERPEEMVQRLALKKAKVVAEKFPDALVIGADTTVDVDGKVFGKPLDKPDAERMLKLLTGRAHRVWTGIALVHTSKGICNVLVEQSEVNLAALNAQEIRAYVETREPLDKAGSYAAQGKGAIFVESIKGSYSNVVGLPLTLLVNELKKIGALVL